MTGTLKITKLKFKSGSKPGAPNLEISPGQVIIFVGPNNSGKSLTIKEIKEWCNLKDMNTNIIDISSIQIDFPTDVNQALSLIGEIKSNPQQDNESLDHQTQYYLKQLPIGNDNPSKGKIGKTFIEQAIKEQKVSLLRNYFLHYGYLNLDCRSRLTLIDTKFMHEEPKNHWKILRYDKTKKELLRKLISEAFKVFPKTIFVFEDINLKGHGNLRPKLSSKEPANDDEETGLNDASKAFHADTVAIENLGDGIKAFIGILSTIISYPHKIAFVDEPEIFLAPGLAKALGRCLLLHSPQSSLLVSTHSSDFLFGCLETNINEITIVRLTYDSGVPTARALTPSELSPLIKDPYLRAADVLQALFHSSVIISEADSDRTFYNEINRKLLEVGRGLNDSLFLNALGKDTICNLISPLRKIGVPAVALADLDILDTVSTTTKQWSKLLDACMVPSGLIQKLEQDRIKLNQIFYSSKVQGTATNRQQMKKIKELGVNALKGADLKDAEKLIASLSKYGLFLVPVGQLENWLPSFNIQGDKNEWVKDFFSKASNISPTNNDIWKFIDDIATWVNDPNKEGID